MYFVNRRSFVSEFRYKLNLTAQILLLLYCLINLFLNLEHGHKNKEADFKWQSLCYTYHAVFSALFRLIYNIYLVMILLKQIRICG
jgi:hypothetical protein